MRVPPCGLPAQASNTGVNFGRRSGVNIQRRLTHDKTAAAKTLGVFVRRGGQRSWLTNRAGHDAAHCHVRCAAKGAQR